MTVKLDRLILGANPFTGVDHFLNERAREKSVRFDPKETLDVMKIAFESGATGFNFATDERGYALLRALNDNAVNTPLGLYAMIPDMKKYVTAQLSKGTMGMLTEALTNLSWTGKAKAVFQGGLSLVTFDPFRALKVFLDIELGQLKNAMPQNSKLKAVLVHEAITDTAIGLGAVELFRNYIKYVKDGQDANPGFVTRNFSQFVSFCSKASIPIDDMVIMTPFNKIGFQMTPTRESCEETLSKTSNTNVIGMSIMAGGQLSLSDAIGYVKKLKLKSVVVGVSTRTHAQETFHALQNAMT